MKIVGILVFCLLWVAVNRRLHKRLINFPSVLTVIWCVSLALSTLGLYDIYPVSDSVIWYSLIFVSAINVFSALFARFGKKPKKQENKAEANIEISNAVLTVILTACSLILLIMLWDGVLVLLETHSFSKVRNAYINYESIGVHAQVLLSITVIPLAKACCTFSIIDLIYNKKIKSNFILTVFFIIVLTLTTGGRSMLVFFVLMLTVALYEKKRSLRKIWSEYRKLLITAMVMLSVALFVTMQRGFSGGGVFQSLYVYFVGCFNLFGVYLSQPDIFFGPLLWGQAMISGFSFPFIEMVRFMGADILPGNYILAEQATSKYIAISPKVAINATPTTMYPAMRDFGVGGLIIYPAVICYAFQKIKNYDEAKNSALSKAIYVNFFSRALLLAMVFQFGTFQNVAVYLYLWIIYKISKWAFGKRAQDKATR